MTPKGNQYAIAALKDRRATMAGEIVRFKQGIRDRLKQLAHLDATLRVLDPSYRSSTIAPKRIRRVKLFGGGELNRLIHDALRRADGKALSTPEIAEAIIEAKGYGHEPPPIVQSLWLFQGPTSTTHNYKAVRLCCRSNHNPKCADRSEEAPRAILASRWLHSLARPRLAMRVLQSPRPAPM